MPRKDPYPDLTPAPWTLEVTDDKNREVAIVAPLNEYRQRPVIATVSARHTPDVLFVAQKIVELRNAHLKAEDPKPEAAPKKAAARKETAKAAKT